MPLSKRGRLARETEPRRSRSGYDAPARRVVVELTKGCTLTFPPALAQGLSRRPMPNSRQSRFRPGLWPALGGP